MLNSALIEYLFFVAFLLLTVATMLLVGWVVKKVKAMYQAGNLTGKNELFVQDENWGEL